MAKENRPRVIHGDCLAILPTLEPNSVDAIVTDPPYHLTSIVKRFGADNAAPAKVGKTGAYARASAGFMGKKWDGGDIAFQPELWRQALRVLKPGGHMVAFGGTRTYHRLVCGIEDAGFEIRDQIQWIYGSGFPKSHNIGEGWGTALKPAHEPIVLARKPLIGTVAENVLAHGTGAINVDGCRVGNDTPPGTDRPANGREGEQSAERRYTDKGSTNFAATPGPRGGSLAGRWPANVIHDGSDEVVGAFPDTGISSGGKGQASQKTALNGHVYGQYSGSSLGQNAGGLGDIGSAARFFYTAKADSDDRLGSKHPTVKPVDLIAYLCRLITPPKGTVLDPFAGSGTTGMACLREGFDCILIEREAEYVADIERRIAHVSGADTPLFAVDNDR
jgi:site-specific DNA-methyltransferase (adenine-specific)